jgi:diguanylate cyclase (GGDEF)-like protein
MEENGSVTRRAFGFLLLPLLFYGGAKLSLALAVMPEVLVMLWIPNAIILAALLRGRGYGLGWVVAILAGEIAADWATFSFAEALSFGAINVLEVTVAYALLRRWRFDSSFATPVDIGKFVVAGPLIATLVSACGAAGIYVLFRGGVTPYEEFLRVWWFSDGLGLLMVTPLALGFWRPLPEAERTRVRWFDGVALAVTLLIVIAFATSQQRQFHGFTLRPFLLIPPALYVATRFNLRVSASAVALLSGFILFITKNGQQPFGDLPMRETVVSAQELVFVLSTMSLSLGALLSQHRRNARQLEARVEERTAALSAANERLQTLASTDSLTGALNRRALFELLQREIVREHRYHRPLAAVIFDIDHFKDVNDRWGHAAGDAVLKRVVAAAQGVVRSPDVLARYGGEEFVIVAPETGRNGALQLAERVRTAVRETETALDGGAIRVTASFGVALLDSGDQRPEDLLLRGDRALYAAKAAGRDCVVVDDVAVRPHIDL